MAKSIGLAGKLKLFSTILLVIVVGCSESQPNKHDVRPSNVPANASWAGGPDGGHWLECHEADTATEYSCKVFSDYDGVVVASGKYLLRKVRWSEKDRASEYSAAGGQEVLEFSFFDGKDIHLKGELVLIPHGIIDYPFDEFGGKQVEYRYGNAMGEGVEYDKEQD